MMNGILQELATEIREVNAANGWGLDFNPTEKRDEIPGYIALIHSEITEAWQELKPAPAMREIGDVIVRCLDLGELMRPGYWADCSPEFAFNTNHIEESWATDLLHLHSLASHALENYRKKEDYADGLLNRLHVMVAHCWRIMRRYGDVTEPERIIREIIIKNRSRGYRHGGRRT